MQKRPRPRPAPEKPSSRPASMQEKLAAVTAALTTDPDKPLSRRCIDAARAACARQISPQTLSDWIKLYGKEVRSQLTAPSNAEVIASTQAKVAKRWADIRDKAMDELLAGDKLKVSAGRDLAVVAGISSDHLSKLSVLSPERTAKIAKMDDLMARLGIDIDKFYDKCIEGMELELGRRTDEQMKRLNDGLNEA